MLYTIWYYWYNLENIKLKPATLLKVALVHGCFFHVFKIVQMVPKSANYY